MTNLSSADQAPLWTPSPDRISATAIDRVRRDIVEATEIQLADSQALHGFSLEHPGDFWDVIWGECGVVGDRGDGPAYVLPPAGKDMRSAQFFPAALISYGQNLLAGGNREGANDEAIIFHREDGVRRTLTWSEPTIARLRSRHSSLGLASVRRIVSPHGCLTCLRQLWR